MAAPALLRSDFDGLQVHAVAPRAKEGWVARRLLALAEIYDGGTRGDAARIGGVGLQTVRDWVLRFNAKGPEGLSDGKAPGRLSRLRDEHRCALVHMIETGSTPAIHGVVRWHLIDLAQWIYEEYAISVPNASAGSADPQSRVACHGLLQAVGAPTPSRQGQGGGCPF